MVLTLIQQGLGLRPREKRALCGKMGYRQNLNWVLQKMKNTSRMNTLTFHDPLCLYRGRLSYGPLVLRAIGPTGHWSYGSLVLCLDHWSYGPSVLRAIGPTRHWSYGPLVLLLVTEP